MQSVIRLRASFIRAEADLATAREHLESATTRLDRISPVREAVATLAASENERDLALGRLARELSSLRTTLAG